MVAFMFSSLDNYFTFTRKCLVLLASDKGMFVAFLVTSILAALTEGMSISLLVPILQSQGNLDAFQQIPILGSIASQFSDYSVNERIRFVSIVIVFVLVFRGIISYTVNVLGQIMPLRLEQQIVSENYSLMMSVRISFLLNRDYGDLRNDISGWATSVSQMLTYCAAAFSNILVLIVYMAMMVLVSWWMCLFAIILLSIMMLILRRVSSGPLHRAGGAANTARVGLDQMAMESLSGMKLIRLHGAEAGMTGRFRVLLDQVVDAQRHMALLVSLSNPVLETCGGVFIAILLFGSAVLHEGDPHAWVGSVLIFLFLMFRLLGPVTHIDFARSRIAGYMPAFERLEQFRQMAQAEREPNGTQPIERLQQDIVLDGVSFAYQSGGRLVLDRISTRIVKGQMTAVVGPSGAGKSTLISLLTRLYDPQAGRILVNDLDLKDLELQSWRRRLAVVSQDIFIFNDTVTNNICFGLSDVPMERVRQAVKLAAADEFVETLPEGYNTLLGDRGMRLSGGQQQRIAIARAILVNPDLLIMDEATSHLDSFSERAIQQAIDHLSKNRTMLVIAHRLSTIRRANKVIVLKDGRIVEEGRHEDLLKQRGIYWEMVEHQRLDLIDEDS